MKVGDSRRVAFFGGSFDPPHLGHLAVARAAREALRLDAVLFAPVGAQPLKPLGSTASFDDRVCMTELAIDAEPCFALSRIDAPSPEGHPNYTLETLKRLRAQLPPHAALFSLMGADSFLSLHQWHGAARIPFAATLIVASRPGQSLADLQSALPAGLTITEEEKPAQTAGGGIELHTYTLRSPAGDSAPFHLLPGLDVEISASEIRAQLQASMEPAACRQLVPAPVARYIREHGLYR